MESTDEHTGHDSPPAQTKDNDSPMISDDEDSDDVSGHSFKDEKPPQLSPVPDLETVDTASNSSKQGTDYEITERLASIEIGLPIVSQELLSEFQVVESSIIERIVDQSGSGLDALYTVEFSDGREDVVSRCTNLMDPENASSVILPGFCHGRRLALPEALCASVLALTASDAGCLYANAQRDI